MVVESELVLTVSESQAEKDNESASSSSTNDSSLQEVMDSDPPSTRPPTAISGDYPSFPSIPESSFHETVENSGATSSSSDDVDSSVSADQERQVLLLMLLAQVCALHDPTPKAFVIHVIELFERGILDRESIRFLFELGLVPSLPPGRPHDMMLLTDGPDETIVSQSGEDQKVSGMLDELALMTRNEREKRPGMLRNAEDQRSFEASSIRSMLADHEDRVPEFHDPTDTRPWDVAHFPLSLSRYQRDFSEISLLASGSFGSVFHAVRKMDGCDYAIKKVTFDAIGYSNKTIQQVIREVQCLASVSDHPNVVRYYTSWLEPSWMTGGGQAGSGATQQKMLTDIQHLMNQDGSDVSDNSEPSSFSNGLSSLLGNRRRGFSFGCSVESVEESWEAHREQSFDAPSRAYDDSYLMDNGHRRRQTSGAVKPTQSYRYQISLYIQMQLCHPATLADWIRERNRRIPECDHSLRVGPALDIFVQIVKGLAHIHEKKIIHRDLKPANIFATTDGKVIKIGDFGLSKQLMEVRGTDGRSPSQPTSPAKKKESVRISRDHWEQFREQDAIIRKEFHSSQVLVRYGGNKATPLTAGIGTASYASPEQVKSRHYTCSADVFSLGLILLELICCFETEHERLHNFQRCRDQRLPAWVDDSYPEISTIILECTRPAPSHRPTARSIVERISQVKPSLLDPEICRLQSKLLETERRVQKQEMELAEKDLLIEKMRLEIERMNCGIPSSDEANPNGEGAKNGPPLAVEEVLSYQDD